jgi:hypothetical protein
MPNALERAGGRMDESGEKTNYMEHGMAPERRKMGYPNSDENG